MIKHDLANKLSALSRDFCAEARSADADNLFPIINFAKIKSMGLLGLVIPHEFGGLGVDFALYQSCISILAQGCAATASAFNMHNIILGALADIPFHALEAKQKAMILPFVERVFGEVLHEQKVLASATSEPGIGARYSKTKTTYEKVPGGYVICGEKLFVTMAEYADYYSIIANKKTTDGQPAPTQHLSFFLIPRTAAGVSIVKEWDTLGMRATQSQRIVFDQVFVPDDLVFMGMTGFALSKIIRAPHWVIGGYIGVYLGIMQAALNFTIEYIKSRSDYTRQTGLAFESVIQLRIAEMYDLYQQAKLTLDDAAKKIITNDDEAHRALYLAKYKVGEAANELTSIAIKTCGGLSIQKKFDLERHFRDARCAALMPATSDVCQIYIGRDLLNLPIENLW